MRYLRKVLPPGARYTAYARASGYEDSAPWEVAVPAHSWIENHKRLDFALKRKKRKKGREDKKKKKT